MYLPSKATMQLEKDARDIFRKALVMHYMEGLPQSGDLVSQWLQKHGGWLPDPQELYGDGTPLTQPADEGVDVESPHPDVIAHAYEIMPALQEELRCLDDACFCMETCLWLERHWRAHNPP